MRDAARPGSYVGNVLGCCAREAASQLAMADRRVVKLRPVPQEPCRRREEPASVQGALRPRVSEGPKRETLQPLRMCPPGRPSGERGSILPVRPLGGCSESKARSYAAGPGFGGRGILQVSRQETLEKARNCVNYRPNNRANGRP